MRLKRATRAVIFIAAVLVAGLGGSRLIDWWQGSAPPERRLATEARAESPNGEHAHTNRLIDETSLYLRQHAHNPVDWYPWGPEAFEKAKEEDKPIFLSVGYSTCYWCHVMEKESFEDEEVAEVLNAHFIAIKVDREERPDVDEQYMLATNLMTGRGGWPNSVWLTPDGRPWMAATYIPKDRFIEVLNTLDTYWDNERDEVEQQADQLAEAMEQAGGQAGAQDNRSIDDQMLERALRQIMDSFDKTRGGFGDAPKFPPHGSLRLLLQAHRHSDHDGWLAPVTKTLDAMWLGGMHDHVGGGFHRYATDEVWLLPHFEKMLYDNAQLMRAYTEAFAATGERRYRQAVEDIFSWLQRQMSSEHGAFYSAMDSGDVGAEGEFYVWHYDEVMEVLGEEDGALFAEIYNIQPHGNYHEEATGERAETNIPHLQKPLERLAADREMEPETLRAKVERMREKLLDRRLTWEPPHTDDKILTSWTGLMIGALARAGDELDDARYAEAAVTAADFLLTTLVDDEGRLLRTYREEQAKQPAYLDDYAYFAEGLLALHDTTGDERWLESAEQLAEVMLAEFEDSEAGGFFFTAAVHDELLTRSKNLMGGGNVPSANGTAAIVLIELAQRTGEARYAEAAQRTLNALSGLMWQNPRSMETEMVAASRVVWGDEQPVADRGDSTSDKGSSPDVVGEPADNAGSEPDVRKEWGEASAEVFASRLTVKPGETFQVAVAIDIAEGWHLYGENPEAEFLIPTTVKVNAEDAGADVGDVVAPDAEVKHDPVLDQELATYEGRIWFFVPITVSDDLSGPVALEVVVNSQACDANRCLQPRTDTLQLPIVVDAEADTEPRHPDVFNND